MDYYQGIVTDYLRAGRALFLNTEFCLQRCEGQNPDFQKGNHWYIDAVAIHMEKKMVYLCEITFGNASALLKKLSAWSQGWPVVLEALCRDAHIPQGWPVRLWLFVPERRIKLLVDKLENISLPIRPLVTPLEMTQPWLYRSWHRSGEGAKPEVIPMEMRT